MAKLLKELEGLIDGGSPGPVRQKWQAWAKLVEAASRSLQGKDVEGLQGILGTAQQLLAVVEV